MKKIITVALMAIAAAASAQTTITGKIKGLKSGEWIYASTFSNPKFDSVRSVKDGFHFKINVPPGEGDMYIIQIGKESAEMIFLDNGNITITGNGPLFKDAKVSGTSSIKEYNDYQSVLEQNIDMKVQEDLYNKANEAYQKHDTITLAALQPKIDRIDSTRKELQKKWVSQHENSPISAYILSNDLRYSLTMTELESQVQKLSAKAKDNRPAKNVLYSIAIDKLMGIGKQAPDFSQNDSLGHAVSLKDFRGKYLLVDFWASWCGPCRAENPNVVKVFNQYKEKNFTILSISFDSHKENWLKAINKDGLAWAHVSDLKGWQNAVGKQYDIKSIPSNLLIGPDGKIIAKNLQGEELGKKLGELLN